jgi:hypothetical protein
MRHLLSHMLATGDARREQSPAATRGHRRAMRCCTKVAGEGDS